MHQSHPAKTYAEAEKRALDLRHNEEGDIRPDSHTRLLTHGAKTKHAIVMFHGFTNSPAQYTILAQIFFENGYNVLLPRLQYHGFIDVLTEDLEKLRASDIVSLTQESVDIAQGLGENVIVLGLSAGGVMAGWAAQHRSDISLAVVISPFLGLAFFPKWFSQTLKTVLPKIPNAFIWWDPRKKEKLPGPAHAYPRVSTHSMAEILIVGAQLLADAHAHPPQAKEILLITNDFDAAIHVKTAKKLGELWQGHGANLRTHNFARAEKHWHDMIDPEQVTQRIGEVYPVLLKLIHRGKIKLSPTVRAMLAQKSATQI